MLPQAKPLTSVYLSFIIKKMGTIILTPEGGCKDEVLIMQITEDSVYHTVRAMQVLVIVVSSKKKLVQGMRLNMNGREEIVI